MRSKIGYGVLGVTVAFLLATNPVVVNAAGFIGSAQIKDNSIKSKDIKNNKVKGVDIRDGSLTAADLAAGTLPGAPVVKRFLGATPVPVPTGARVFLGPTATVVVDGNDAVVGSGSMKVNATVDGSDFDYGLCIRAVGAVTEPQALGGSAALATDIDGRAVATANEALDLTRSGSDVPAAGSYTVGMCGSAFVAGEVTASLFSGWVQVLANAGTLAKPVGNAKAGSDEG